MWYLVSYWSVQFYNSIHRGQSGTNYLVLGLPKYFQTNISGPGGHGDLFIIYLGITYAMVGKVTVTLLQSYITSNQ